VARQQVPGWRRHPLKLEKYETLLRDGTPVLVRPIRPEDKELLRRGFERLSEESRYRRFMTAVTELSEEQLRYLTEINYIDHFAWAAMLRDRPDEGLGVARYVRLQDEPDVAEAAITVVDDYQGKGLGTLLLGLLAVAARAADIRAFRAWVLAENTPVIDLLEQVGAQASYDEPGVIRLDVPLDPALLPDSPAARVLRAIAERVVTPVVRPITP
jgi:RimJ/RimL family protein N-acetyltransferase